jgi:hypothetical protein
VAMPEVGSCLRYNGAAGSQPLAVERSSAQLRNGLLIGGERK